MVRYTLDDSIVKPPVKVSLNLDGKGGVEIMANGWYVATLTPEGRLLLHAGIGQELGFELDDEDRIVVEYEG